MAAQIIRELIILVLISVHYREMIETRDEYRSLKKKRRNKSDYYSSITQ